MTLMESHIRVGRPILGMISGFVLYIHVSIFSLLFTLLLFETLIAGSDARFLRLCGGVGLTGFVRG